jgi:hypothetical protein
LSVQTKKSKLKISRRHLFIVDNEVETKPS